MREVLFEIGPVNVYGYGFMIAVGVVVCFMMADYRLKKYGLDADLGFNIGFVSIIMGFIGAKFFFVVSEIPDMIAGRVSLWQVISGSGFVVYGGLIFGVATAVFCTWRKKVDFLPYFDIAVPSIAVAQGFGRLGCFMAGCCYGLETDSPLGIVFTHSRFAPNNVSLIPTQLISSFGDFAIMGVLLWYARKKPKAGRVAGLYILLYGVGRFIVEFMRNDYRGAVGPLSVSQWIAILLLAPGIWLMFLRKEKVAA